jgi:hypothetical protein
VKEMDIEGLSSSMVWKCSNYSVIFVSLTSTKIKFTGIKGKKPKVTINLQAVGRIMIEGSIFKTLEAIMGSIVSVSYFCDHFYKYYILK